MSEQIQTPSPEFPKNKGNVPWFLQMWFILLISLLTSAFIFIPGIILFVIRLVKYPTKRKTAWIAMAAFIGVFVAASVMLVWYAEADDRAVEKYIKAGDYDGAISYIDENFDATTYSYYRAKSDVYAAKNDYDLAAKALLSYSDLQTDLSSLPSDLTNRLMKYSEKTSEDVKNQISAHNTLVKEEKEALEAAKRAEEERLAKEKEEQERKAEEEKIAKEKADQEKLAAEAQAIAEEKARKEEAERKANIEKERARQDELDKEEYGMTADEFAQELARYSDLPDFDTDEEYETFIHSEFDEWKKNPTKAGWRKNSSGKWEMLPTMEMIASEGIGLSYKDAMRNPDKYTDTFVYMPVEILQAFSNNDRMFDVYGAHYSERNAQIRRHNANDHDIIEAFPEYVANYDEHFVIKDERTGERMRLLEGDIVNIYGKFEGLETYTYTLIGGNQEKRELPVISVYYTSLLQE